MKTHERSYIYIDDFDKYFGLDNCFWVW